MGWFSWLFPSADDRVARARRFLDQNRPDEARLELLDLDHPEAPELLATAHHALARLNLEAAVGYARAGDDDRVDIHLELADQFHEGGLEDEFRATRRELRQVREARQAEAQAEKRAEQAKLFDMDVPSELDDGTAGLLPHADDPDREVVEQRIALLVENYPDALEASVRELGPDFVSAVLDLEDGHADKALLALLDLPDQQPLVQWERARAAHALGDASSAATALRAFAQHANGHHPFGRLHSGTYLAQLLAESGQPEEALRVLRDVRRKAPNEGAALFAQLLWVTGDLATAETVTKDLLERAPKAMPLYGLLARIRLSGDHRVQAMRALEAGIEATTCPPGRCGHQAPDLDAHRLLATLYLEDGIETRRALELSSIAAGLVERPSWEDAYLQVLVARATREPEASAMIERLLAATPPEDPRRTKVEALTG